MAPLVLEARGPWTPEEAAHHITWKEMRAVRYAIESFLPHLAGRKVGLLEDNQGVDHILHSSVSKTPLMQAELRPLWWLLCTHNIALESTYVRSARLLGVDAPPAFPLKGPRRSLGPAHDRPR